MIAVIARLNVAEGKETQFEEAMLGLVRDVRNNEPGNELYTLCRDPNGRYVVLELYADDQALAVHRDSDHFKAAGARFAGLMAGRPEIERLEVVE
jgi:quinol monooxygenase YgiN